MSNIIKCPPLRNLRSMISLPVTMVAIDLEYVRDELNSKFCVCELAIWDIYAESEIFRTFIKPEDNFLLSRRMQERGITEEDIRNAPSMVQLDKHLKYLLRSFVSVFWNEEADIRNYPTLKSYSYGTRCCMKRHRDRHGHYSVDFGDHHFIKLEKAAKEMGFLLEDGDEYHRALVDAKACGYIWKELDKETLPASIPLDLVLRDDVYRLIKEGEILEEDNSLIMKEDKNSLPF